MDTFLREQISVGKPRAYGYTDILLKKNAKSDHMTIHLNIQTLVND